MAAKCSGFALVVAMVAITLVATLPRILAQDGAAGCALPDGTLAEEDAGEESIRRPRSYTAFDASRDAYVRGERQRQQSLGRQIGVIQYNRWWNGLPPTIRPGHAFPQDRASFYAFGVKPLPGGQPGVFERWPYLPGDIWGYSYDTHVPQSVGQRRLQTGPNRWESHPVYAAPTFVPPARRGPRAY